MFPFTTFGLLKQSDSVNKIFPSTTAILSRFGDIVGLVFLLKTTTLPIFDGKFRLSLELRIFDLAVLKSED